LQVQYANSVRSAADVQGAILDEAIRRTGLSYEELEGKSTKAFQSALSDVKTIINGMDDLKDRGVDVGELLMQVLVTLLAPQQIRKKLMILKRKLSAYVLLLVKKLLMAYYNKPNSN
jgi:hypothetical protein